MSNALFDKASPLLTAPVPALSTLLQSNIDMLNELVAKYSVLDLTEPTKTSLAVIIGGGQPPAAISAAAVLVKTQAKSQGVEIDEASASVIAQAITNGVLNAIQVAVSAPAPQVSASPSADQEGAGAGTETTSAAA